MLQSILAFLASLAFAAVIALLPARAQEAAAAADGARLDAIVGTASTLPRLQALIVAHQGKAMVEHVFRGPGLDRAVNIKSASKSVISALVGIAIDKGIFTGPDQTIASVFGERMPDHQDPRIHSITIEDLITMRSGLERTSGANYRRWVSSSNWVRAALTRPFVDEPGGRMLYSTGNTHILSAALTRASGSDTLELAREWLAEPLGISIPSWQRDPQGIYFGGNNMALSPRALLAFGELYRNGGMANGRRVLSEEWVKASWTPRTASFYTGHGYGYGWFTVEMAGRDVFYAWGYGGQMLYVVPDLELTVVMTSDLSAPSHVRGYVDSLHGLLENEIIPAIEETAAADGSR